MISGLINCCKKFFVYLLPFLFFCMKLVELASHRAYLDDSESISDEMTLKKHRILSFEALLAFTTYLLSVLMFSPDLAITLFVYTPIFIAARVTQLILRYDMTDKDNLLWYTEEMTMMIVMTSLLFYIYHSTELENFFKSQEESEGGC